MINKRDFTLRGSCFFEKYSFKYAKHFNADAEYIMIGIDYRTYFLESIIVNRVISLFIMLGYLLR